MRRAGLSSGTVAVIGGPQVYTLFLKLGYDCFHLSRAVNVRLPGGVPLFGGDPDAALAAAGLKARPPLWLEDGLTLTDWVRALEYTAGRGGIIGAGVPSKRLKLLGRFGLQPADPMSSKIKPP